MTEKGARASARLFEVMVASLAAVSASVCCTGSSPAAVATLPVPAVGVALECPFTRSSRNCCWLLSAAVIWLRRAREAAT